MKAYGIDHYDQTLTMDVCQTLKRVQGGDDIPLVMEICDNESNGVLGRSGRESKRDRVTGRSRSDT